MPSLPKCPLAGTRIAITRPAGTGAALARKVRALGGTPLLLPGSSLIPNDAPDAARAVLREALAADVAIFTSPAAVRFGARLCDLRTRARVLAPGRGTAAALHHAGVCDVIHPDREDSEGLLALSVLRDVRGKRVGLIGAAGGRGLLQRELAARGGAVVQAYVYRRMPPRLDRRHSDALLRDPHAPLFVLLTSSQSLANILDQLPATARRALLAGTAVASSERLADAARDVGFAHVIRAASVHAAAMLASVVSNIDSKQLL
ncbi:MAG: uroporphyrinogen-III synthase [Rhodanobacteraceae bacterium]